MNDLKECSCHGNNPECYKCGGKGFLNEDDLIPGYTKFSYPTATENSSKVKSSSKNYGKPGVPNVVRKLEIKISQANKRKALISKNSQSAGLKSNVSKRFGKKTPKDKQGRKGNNDINNSKSKFSSSGESSKNKITAWSPDQILLMERIRENIKFMEPHYNKAKQNKTR